MRRACRAKSRCRTSSGRLGLDRAAQRRIALLLTLFTFCPPGPELRAKLNRSSRAGISQMRGDFHASAAGWFGLSLGHREISSGPTTRRQRPRQRLWIFPARPGRAQEHVGWVEARSEPHPTKITAPHSSINSANFCLACSRRA